jgi:tRNA threonylcarbamoyladenosine biosynthesis protein TsaB
LRTLALDTTNEFGSIALLDDSRVMEETVLHSPDGFAHVIFDEIAGMLARSGVELDQIDCFAAGAGPGSFTGVRVGLAAIKGLAATLGKKAAAVSNLKAVASLGSAPVRGAVIDARRGEIYAGVYNAELQLLEPEVAMRFADWIAALSPGAQIVSWQAKRQPLAAAIGRLAVPGDPALIDANYVRRPDIR